MTSLVWLGLGNLALAAPLAIVAWLSGRLARRPAITHGLWVLVLLKLVTPPIGWVPVGRFDDLERPEPAMQHPVVAREWDEWEQIAVAPTMIAPQTPTNDEVAAGLTPLNAPAGLDTTEGAPTPIEQVTNNAIEEPNFADPIDSAPVAAKTNPGNGDPVPGPTSDHFAEIRPWVVPGIGGLWLAGAFVVWARFVQRSMRFRKLLANAAAAPEVVRERVARLAGELGIRAPDVVFVQSAISPLLWVSGRRAVLVLPRTLFEQLDSEQQATLLVHELAHWKRGDHWVRRLECLAGGLYWWCPLVWWAQAGLRQAEEECCDAWVTATVPGSERTYALALVETVDFLAGARTLLPPLASGLGPFPSLQRRLTMIFHTGTPKRLSLAGLIGLFGLGGLMLTWSPVPIAAQAQEGDEAKSEKKTFKLQLSGGGGAAVVQDDELPRVKKKADQPAPEKRAGQPKREALGDASAEIERLRTELRMRQAELDRLQREIDRQARELQSRIDQAGVAPAAPGPRPGAGAPPRPEPTPRLPVPPTAPLAPVQPFPPGARAGGGPGFAPGGPGFGEKGGGVSPVERRMDNLERKLDRMIEELTNLRREMSNRGGPGGPGGQGGFGGGFPGGGQGGFGGGGQGAFGGGGGGGFGGQGGGFFKKNPPATPPGADPSPREQREPQGVVPPPVQRKKDANFESNGNTPNPAANGGLRGAGTGVRVPSPRPAAENNDGFDPAPVAPRRVDDPSKPARQSS